MSFINLGSFPFVNGFAADGVASSLGGIYRVDVCMAAESDCTVTRDPLYKPIQSVVKTCG